ncbi:sulfur oxidation c-type cytochrome SoxX [Bosea sp. 117]|uniref:sulfur oxidation c-type cytochrome SoxX n=1 Tax=Bosea sp. 117 TaxID=1125973 RepID=UPI0004945B26|nr:sulfur oxidation c-type cytochrome SoxX [Bosea sp. 117]
MGAALLALTAPAGAQPVGATDVPTLIAYEVAGDAITGPLGGTRGDADRGAKLVAERQKSLCVLCHSGPFPDPHLQGNLAPDLKGVGVRLSEGQIRLRVVDMKRLNPASIMPAYYGLPAGERVAATWRGRPILEPGEIEDIVAYLVTLKDE